MIYILPKLYVNDGGHFDESVLFVKVGNDRKKQGNGTMERFQRVKKIFSGVYITQKKSFFDFTEMYKEIK